MKAAHAGIGGCVEEAFRGREGKLPSDGSAAARAAAARRVQQRWKHSAHARTVFDWERVLREGCFADTDRGPVSQEGCARALCEHADDY